MADGGTTTRPRIKIPTTARKGEVVEIRTLVAHVMETGFRKDEAGRVVPREIINRFTCEFNGKSVFSADLEPGIAANPYLKFFARVEESGAFRFAWFDDNGTVTTAEEKIEVG